MAFSRRNAVVTGGASGIGLQVCNQLLSEGIENVAIIDIQDNPFEFERLRAAHHPKQQIILIKADIANEKEVDAAFVEIIERFSRIDIVVNVAGIFNDQNVTRTLLVNLGGTINTTLAAMKVMSKENGGNGGIISNISSVVGLDPFFLVPIYSATKHGIIGFTRCLGNEMYIKRTGIKFLTICPSATDTDMFTSFGEKMLFPSMSTESYQVLDRLHKQSAADVSKCILIAIKMEENGAVYIIESKKLFPITMTRYWRSVESKLNAE